MSAKPCGSCVPMALQLGLTQMSVLGNCSVPHLEHLPPVKLVTVSRLRHMADSGVPLSVSERMPRSSSIRSLKAR